MSSKTMEENSPARKPFVYFLVQKGMEEEAENFRGIKKISDEQQIAIQDSNIDLLNKLIQEKQRLMDQIDRIEKKITPARNVLKNNISSLSNDVLINLRKVYGTLQSTMEDVKIRDKEVLLEMSRLKDESYRNLIELRKNNRIISNNYLSYNVKTPVPYFFDKKS